MGDKKESMSYYRVKNITIKKDGSISMVVADNNTRPITYFRSDYHGSVADLLGSIYDGNFHLNKTKSLEKFAQINDALSKLMKTLDNAGLTWEKETIIYKLDDRRKYLSLACEMFADKLTGKFQGNNAEFNAILNGKLSEIIIKGQQNLKDRKEKDKAEGIIRVPCAAVSIFTDRAGNEYDLLMPYESENGFILAPAKDYNNAGILKTDPKNIVELGEESKKLYHFLSFSGVGISFEECIESGLYRTDEIKAKFKNVHVCIQKAHDAGLILKTGVTPYENYPAAAFGGAI